MRQSNKWREDGRKGGTKRTTGRREEGEAVSRDVECNFRRIISLKNPGAALWEVTVCVCVCDEWTGDQKEK